MLWLMSVDNIIAIVFAAAVAAAAILEILMTLYRTPSVTRIMGSKQALQGEVNACALEMSVIQCQCGHP